MFANSEKGQDCLFGGKLRWGFYGISLRKSQLWIWLANPFACSNNSALRFVTCTHCPQFFRADSNPMGMDCLNVGMNCSTVASAYKTQKTRVNQEYTCLLFYMYPDTWVVQISIIKNLLWKSFLSCTITEWKVVFSGRIRWRLQSSWANAFYFGIFENYSMNGSFRKKSEEKCEYSGWMLTQDGAKQEVHSSQLEHTWLHYRMWSGRFIHPSATKTVNIWSSLDYFDP